ncbi:hypothetical protein [Phaeodactylibacter luteus]|uniref:BamA/TamA family outer membrane protein n=1 Tax=Phaeodactylibacter luteus TaxID=1564516 RepID=A0A5C6RMW2_9BACT|nr:hypothetical protein [Phaeodactylibacter luteus]TXB63269.1 hypothetical protein FRY97_09810 [Phaeodactylibacter luteus]
MRLYLRLLLPLFLAGGLHAQGIQVEFGKNRVQYHDDFAEWAKYESDNFITYWYGEGRFIGQAVVQLAEQDSREIQNVLEHRINEKIQLIVYTDITDVKQSNIGSEDTFMSAAGQTKIVGNKVFVYFDGNHRNLRKQVREGIASVYLNAMLFGSNIQEIVQNAVMMNLPEWFKDGLIGYVGERWNPDLDNELRDYILSENFDGFEGLVAKDPKLAGHSLWYYIAENYGRSQVSNLLYLTRINRSIDNGFLYVLGTPYERVGDSWAIFFRQRYEQDASQRDSLGSAPVPFKNKRGLPVTQVKLSPSGQQLLYVLNEIGKYRVYLYDLATGKQETIFRQGFRNAFQATDYNYPHVAWNPNGQQVAILYEKRDIAYLRLYEVRNGKHQEEPLSSEYQRVYSMDFVNPITMVFTAAVRGQSDLFLYYTNTRQTQRITNDFWDDLDATYVEIDNQKGILFASNRQDTLIEPAKLDSILPIDDFDIFYYDLENRSRELVRITNTPYANERQPMGVDTTWFSYLSDRSGIYNRESGYLEEYLHHYDQLIYLEDGSEIRMHADSALESLDTSLIDTIILEPIIKKRAITQPNTNYGRNILSQHKSRIANRAVQLALVNGEHQIHLFQPEPEEQIAALGGTSFQEKRSAEIKKAVVVPDDGRRNVQPELSLLQESSPIITVDTVPVKEAQRDTGRVDIDNYLFQSEFDDEDDDPAIIIVEESEEADAPQQVRVITNPSQISSVLNSNRPSTKKAYDFNPSRITNYRLEFRTDFVTTQLDNSLLFDGLNSFAANPDGFNLPNPGILLKANFKDLFEDYEFEGGVRVPTTFNGTEYFITFADKKRRLDRHYAVYRRNQRFSYESLSFVPNRNEVNILLGQYGVRYPLDIFRSLRATATLRRDRVTQLATERASLEVPTRSDERAGIRLEYVFDNTLDVALNIKNGSRYKVYVEGVKKFDINLSDGASFDLARGAMGIIGFDARHYQRFLKHSVIALRAAGATSFGSERMIYFLGGVDNWLFNSFNNEIPIPSAGADIAFQALATNMRGFDLNIRNGNSYLLSNIELRMPIFKYFSNRLRSPFLRNFQLVGFFDVGTAWEGRDPYSIENPLNTSIVDNSGLVSVKVNYFRDPLVAGYGAGVRAMLFGYFVRADYAWGIETRQVQDPKFYLSIGTDF